jgi:phospholipid/cholesterol/gamma-HCH transport system substrate-binding protein
MEPNKNAFLVGCLVVSLIAVAIGSGVWLARAGREQEPERYAVFFVKQSLSGLESGASVTMLGITVGQVETVSIDPADFTRVRVSVALRPGTPVTESTTALISRNLLTGLATIELAGSSPESPRIMGASVREDHLPEIREGIPQLVQLQRTLPVILEHTDKLLTSAGEILNDENREKFAKIIANIEVMSGGLSEATQNLHRGAEQLNGVIQGFINHLDKRSAEISDNFSRTSGEVTRQVGTVSGALNDTLRAVTRLVEALEHPRRILLGPSQRDLGPGEQVPEQQ